MLLLVQIIDVFAFFFSIFSALKGAKTLKARSRCKNILNGSTPVLPIEDNVNDLDFDFEKCRLLLAKGIELGIETSDGRWIRNLHSISMYHSLGNYTFSGLS